jgi:hypothetical protein
MNDQDLEQRAAEFFREFARYEYCLKAAGLLKTDNNGQPKAEANWRRYANEAEIRDLFEARQEGLFTDAVNFYLNAPPRKQVIKAGVLDWDPVLPDHVHEADLVLQLICRTRNNLFHGGKFNGHWFAPQRSLELISYGLTILAACANAHPQVRLAYADRME